MTSTSAHSPTGTARTGLLRFALGGNAAFSAACGGALLAAPATIAAFFGWDAATVFRFVGAGLLLFAADLVHQATRPRLATWRALYASAADFAWVAASFGALAIWPGAFGASGAALLLAVAAAVAGFGTAQILGIRRVHSGEGKGEYRHCLRVVVPAPVASLWDVVADLGGIARYFPDLRASSVREGRAPGLGAVRECEDRKGHAWAEECTAFVPGRRLELRFLAEAPGFPFPAERMRGGWELIPAGPNHCIIMVWWELVPKPRWAALLLLPLLAFKADRDFPRILGRMAEEARGEGSLTDDKDGRVPADTVDSPGVPGNSSISSSSGLSSPDGVPARARARLLPQIC